MGIYNKIKGNRYLPIPDTKDELSKFISFGIAINAS